MRNQQQNQEVRAEEYVTDIIPANTSKVLELKLPNYIGFTKEFVANTSSQSTSGIVLLYLYKPNGELASNDWMMGVKETAKWKFTLPTAGTWRIKVVAHLTNAPVTFSAKWV